MVSPGSMILFSSMREAPIKHSLTQPQRSLEFLHLPRIPRLVFRSKPRKPRLMFRVPTDISATPGNETARRRSDHSFMPTQKHGDTTSQDVEPGFLLLCHKKTTFSETGFLRIGFGARNKVRSCCRHGGKICLCDWDFFLLLFFFPSPGND
ncbi:hypothetical protein V6N13_058146 [Hibiscus sabdariffa]